MMNKFRMNLLKQSYAHYKITRDREFQFQMHTSDDMCFYPDAAEWLSDEGYIEPLSNNIGSDFIDPISESVLVFEITNAGIKYIEQILKSETQV